MDADTLRAIFDAQAMQLTKQLQKQFAAVLASGLGRCTSHTQAGCKASLPEGPPCPIYWGQGYYLASHRRSTDRWLLMATTLIEPRLPSSLKRKMDQSDSAQNILLD
ncbi:hypothetical protein Y032_0606g579 [Ancylostoma ceylanicum]|uniref:Uncharacterized protein n=1 Tax=Ancylostoma ceylanicum TaxID=53326 RepID=A0A016WLX5_9BILA|nr:hypothetical protein Y032_0606g579 [Ancylostoma ceylanicum]